MKSYGLSLKQSPNRPQVVRARKPIPINQIVCGNCLDFMKRWSKNCVDLILTDPPYKIIPNKRGKGTGFYSKTDHLADIDESFGTSFDPLIYLDEMLRISSHGLVQWTSQALLLEILNYVKRKRMKWDLLFWHKTNSCPAHYNHLMPDTEYGIRIYKSGAYFNNSLDYPYYHKYYLDTVQHLDGHPTPKPLALMQKQVLLYSKPNDLILDPFCGSGTTCLAAKILGRRYIGIDITEKYCDLSRARIAGWGDENEPENEPENN